VVTDHLNIIGYSGAGRGADGCVHAGTVTAAGQDCKSFHESPRTMRGRLREYIVQRFQAEIEYFSQSRRHN
jgi:hypothetical protein